MANPTFITENWLREQFGLAHGTEVQLPATAIAQRALPGRVLAPPEQPARSAPVLARQPQGL